MEDMNMLHSNSRCCLTALLCLILLIAFHDAQLQVPELVERTIGTKMEHQYCNTNISLIPAMLAPTLRLSLHKTSRLEIWWTLKLRCVLKHQVRSICNIALIGLMHKKWKSTPKRCVEPAPHLRPRHNNVAGSRTWPTSKGVQIKVAPNERLIVCPRQGARRAMPMHQ